MGRRVPQTPPRHLRLALAALAAALGLAVVVLRFWVGRVAPLPGDEAIAARFPNPRTPESLTELATFFAAVGTPLVALLTVAAIAWLVDRRLGRRRAVGVWLAAASAAGSTALKVAWGPTPLWERINPDGGANYPSGHVTYATALFGFLAYLAFERRRLDLAAVAVLLAGGMGAARIGDGSHLPSDVLGGYLLGLAWLSAVVVWVTRPEPSRWAAR